MRTIRPIWQPGSKRSSRTSASWQYARCCQVLSAKHGLWLERRISHSHKSSSSRWNTSTRHDHNHTSLSKRCTCFLCCFEGSSCWHRWDIAWLYASFLESNRRGRSRLCEFQNSERWKIQRGGTHIIVGQLAKRQKSSDRGNKELERQFVRFQSINCS